MTQVNRYAPIRLPEVFSMFDGLFGEEDSLLKMAKKGTTVPAVNVSEADNEYTLELAAPGKSRKDFKVEVKNNQLTISSENETSDEVNEKNFTRKEYNYNSFSRSFGLPKNVNEDAILAKYENGVLIVSIPKVEPTKPESKKIPVV